MSDKLQQFEAELRKEHEALTAAFEAKQIEAEARWAEYEAAKAAVATFRAKYGRVLRALDATAITVTEG